MSIQIGNAPCSWGVEFADDPHNPDWKSVLKDCADAGYKGIELGPVGYMPEDAVELAEGLDEYGLELIGGVIFRPWHDPQKWDQVMDGAIRTCKALKSHGAKHLVLIDSISARRAPTVGRPHEAEQMDLGQWSAFVERIRTIAKIGTQEYGLTVGIHAHAGGFIDFKPELLRLLNEVDSSILKICLDTGHCEFAGFDPVSFMTEYIERISYMHFKDIDPVVRARVIAERTDFYKACAQGIFCNLGQGKVDFPAVKHLLNEHDFNGWCTVEQDCDPAANNAPVEDARQNRRYLESIGF